MTDITHHGLKAVFIQQAQLKNAFQSHTTIITAFDDKGNKIEITFFSDDKLKIKRVRSSKNLTTVDADKLAGEGL